jgi:hypothetical protein
MKTIFLSLLAGAALVLSGCATTTHEHGMACSKCACKMMAAMDTDMQKCKMCGHSEAEHNVAAPSEEHHH